MLKAIRLALKQIELPQTAADPAAHWAVNVVLLDDQQITDLNEQFLGHEGPTDVITFDLTEGSLQGHPQEAIRLIGEIYVSLPVAERASCQYSTGLGYEVVLYIVHGLLHLAGEDDLTPEARIGMRAAEKRVMSALSEALPLNEIFC
jgi:probable rRNA maturation factor